MPGALTCRNEPMVRSGVHGVTQSAPSTSRCSPAGDVWMTVCAVVWLEGAKFAVSRIPDAMSAAEGTITWVAAPPFDQDLKTHPFPAASTCCGAASVCDTPAAHTKL